MNSIKQWSKYGRKLASKIINKQIKHKPSDFPVVSSFCLLMSILFLVLLPLHHFYAFKYFLYQHWILQQCVHTVMKLQCCIQLMSGSVSNYAYILSSINGLLAITATGSSFQFDGTQQSCSVPIKQSIFFPVSSLKGHSVQVMHLSAICKTFYSYI